LKTSSFSTHWTETGEVVRFFGNFFLPLPTGGKWAVWPKGSETFFSHYPLDSSGLFERKNFKFSFHSALLTKITAWSKESETFFSQYPTDTWSRFERKKIEKALGKFPKAVDFFTFS